MFIGRFAVILPALAIAGALASKRKGSNRCINFSKYKCTFCHHAGKCGANCGSFNLLPCVLTGTNTRTVIPTRRIHFLGGLIMTNEKSTSIFEPKTLLEALIGSFKRLNPIILLRNPVILIVEIGAIITTLIGLINLIYGGNFLFNIQISIWLWFTVIFCQLCRITCRNKR